MTVRNLRPRLLAALASGLLLAGAGLAAGPANVAGAASDPGSVTAAVNPTVPGFIAVAPRRLLDTRTSTTTPTLSPASTVSVKVTGVAAVPATNVRAVVLNVTAIAYTHSTFVTVFPTGSARPQASNLNVALNQTRANQVFAIVGTGGMVSLYNSSSVTDLVVDVTGYLTSTSSYAGQAPARVLDTRTGGGAPLTAATTRTVQVTGAAGVPAGVSAVVLNLTGISTASGAFITAYPSDTARPPTSNLNLIAGQTAAVLVVASLSDDGQVTLYNSGGPTHLILDVEGWFTSTKDYIPVTPTRLVDTRGPDTVPYGQDTEIPGAALGNAPPGSGAAVLSVTAVNPSASGYVTVHAGGTAVPTTSSLNTSSSGTVANLVVTQLSPTGSFAIFDRAPGADILVDVVGWLHTNRALSFPAPGIGPGEVGQPYDATLGQAGGLAPYTWVTASGALPDGLTLSATDGSVSGTPTSDGPDVATIRIRDSSGQSVQRTLNFKTYPFVSSTLWGWGWDGFNQLPPQTQDSSVPQQLSAQSGVKDVSVSYSEGLAVHQDGTLWTWGGNQLVDNGPTGGIPASAPVQITDLTGVDSVAQGSNTSYALLSDGTVWAWGEGTFGALGNGQSADSADPVQVSGLTDVIAVTGGTLSGYALKSDGTVWAWGANLPTVQGNGGATSSTVPRLVTGVSGVSAIAAGPSNGYAVRSDGTVWAWGEGGSGQLGNGGLSDTRAPTQVATITDATQVAAGGGGAYALASDGTVWAWGNDQDGELGDGGSTDSATPVQVDGVSGVTQVAAGGRVGYALLADGSVWAWGSDSNGLLGDGVSSPDSRVDTPAPVVVPPAQRISANWFGFSAFTIGAS